MPTGLFTNYLERRRHSVIGSYVYGNILDAGCGYGAFIKEFHPDPKSYLGIEKSTTIFHWLCEHYPEYQFLNADVEKDSLPDLLHIDTVICLAVFEHLHKPDRFLCRIDKAISKNARLIITTPSPMGGALHGIGSRMGLFSRDARLDHQGFYSKTQMVELLQQHSFRIVKCTQFLGGLNHLIIGEHQ